MEAYEQIGISAIDKEKKDFKIELFSNIVKIIEREFVDTENVTLKNNKLYQSVCFFDHPKLRIKTVKTQLYLEIPGYYQIEIKRNNINYIMLKNNYMRTSVPEACINKSLEALILNIYDQCYWKYSEDRFDCCSSYMECSDLKECIHLDNKKFSASCRYNKTMTKEGKIFFGKNRNID